MNKAEIIYENRKYISPIKYDEMLNRGWSFELFPFGGGIYNQIIDRINQLLESNIVITGWMSTSIKGHHDNFFIYKKKD